MLTTLFSRTAVAAALLLGNNAVTALDLDITSASAFPLLGNGDERVSNQTVTDQNPQHQSRTSQQQSPTT
jgi:hypothetical protein